MGIFWELMQENKLQEQEERAETLEDRIQVLEKDLASTKVLLRKTLEALEEHLHQDIDGDGHEGSK